MGVLDFKGEFATNTRPAREASGRLPWAKNPTAPGDSNGTRLDATFINDLRGLILGLFTAAGTTPDAGDDTAFASAVSALIATAVAAKANIASPTFTGVPSAPTADPGTNSEQIATTEFVAEAVAALIDGAPGALDTLEELAAAFGDDENFAATMTTALAGKQGLNALLTALAALTTAANKGLYFSGSDTPATYDLSSFVRGISNAADAAAFRTAIGAGSGGGDVISTNNLSDMASKIAAFNNLHTAGADIASASTVDLDAATGWKLNITGTTTVTAVTLASGKVRWAKASAAFQLTHGANLILPGSANYTTAAGDILCFLGEPSSVVRVLIFKADGTPVAGSIAWGPWTNLASASTADLSTISPLSVNITGTTTITSFGTGANLLKFVKFAGALTLTHNATSLILPGGANITTAAGDTLIAVSDGSGNWTVLSYSKAAGPTISKSYLSSDQTLTAAGLLTLAHSLGVAPKVVTAFYVCTSAEGNYSVGDVVCCNVAVSGSLSASGQNINVTVDATNLLVRMSANGFKIADKTSGTDVTLTTSKWKLRMGAYA